MQALICKNCSGSDLRPFPGHPDIVKCSYCGTTYKLDSSGNISQEQKQDLQIKQISILFIILIFIILAIIGFLSLKPESAHSEKKIIVSEPISVQPSTSSPENEEKEASGEITEITEVVSRYTDTVYYIGKYKNTGSVILEKPNIQFSFYDENDSIVDTASGYGYQNIEPGQETGFNVMTKKQNRIHKRVIEHYPNQATYNPEKAKLKLSDVKIVKGDYSTYSVIGTIENESDFSASFVSVNCILYSKDKKAMGIGYTYISQKSFKPKAKSVFRVDFYGLDGTPTGFWIESNGRKEK